MAVGSLLLVLVVLWSATVASLAVVSQLLVVMSLQELASLAVVSQLLLLRQMVQQRAEKWMRQKVPLSLTQVLALEVQQVANLLHRHFEIFVHSQ